MANLTVQVDQTIGNYEQTFVFSLDVSFNGIQSAIESAYIKVFFPSYIDITLGDAQFPIKDVLQVPIENGVEVTYLFDSITDLGVVVRVGIGALFNTTAQSGQTYICSPQLFINGNLYLDAESSPIQLSLIPQFELSRELVLPTIAPAPGGSVIYKVTLENFGDLGSTIENVLITCNGSDTLLLDPEFVVIGKDNSSKFSDTSMDGIIGVFDNNQFSISLIAYKGQRYEFYYKGVLNSDASIGEQISTISTLSIDGVIQSNNISEFTIIAPTYQAALGIYGPEYSLPNEYLCYRINVHNTGNQELTNAIFENQLPDGVQYYQLQTGSFFIAAIDQNLSIQYFIDYETRNGVTGTLGPFNSDVNTTVNLESIITADDNLSKLFWNLNSLDIGVKNRNVPQVLGIIKPDSNGALQNHIYLSYRIGSESFELVENFSTLLGNYCVLRPRLDTDIGITPVKPSDTIRYTLSFNCRSSRLENPLMAIILPDKLEYIGNVSYNYNNFFPSIVPPNPPESLISDFDGNGSTLVKFEFKDDYAFSFHQLCRFSISFDTKVRIGAIGRFQVFSLLNSLSSTGVIPSAVEVYSDTFNIAQDPSVTIEYAKSSTLDANILFFVATSSNMKVKGYLDTTFVEEPLVGHTYSGGSLQYLISIKNIGNAIIESVEIVDILPYVGDTGVIETTTLRLSEYPIYSLSEIVTFMDSLSTEADLEIYSSTSKDPLRFGKKFDVIGKDDNWTLDVPEDLSTVQSFKLKSKNLLLLPNETIKIAVMASTPVSLPISSVSWNSFAASVVYRDLNNIPQTLLAIEPEKTGVEIVAPDANTFTISGYSWFDTNLDGLHQDKESLLNDVGVLLYNENNQLLQYTFTRTDANGDPGKYNFSNLPLGKYYLQFLIDQKQLKFTKQRLNYENGSKANSKTGQTEIIDLTIEGAQTTIHVGVVGKNDFTLDEILAVNRQARSMVRSTIHNQMLLTMKQEDVLDLLKSSKL